MAYAARVMRGLIIDLVRERCALKRGGAFHITQLPTEVEESSESADPTWRFCRTPSMNSQYASRAFAGVVDLKYFCGFTFDEIAAQRGTSMRTVMRDWEKARLILFRGLNELPRLSEDYVIREPDAEPIGGAMARRSAITSTALSSYRSRSVRRWLAEHSQPRTRRLPPRLSGRSRSRGARFCRLSGRFAISDAHRSPRDPDRTAHRSLRDGI